MFAEFLCESSLFQLRSFDLPLTRWAFDGTLVPRCLHMLYEVFGKVVQFVTFGASEGGPEVLEPPVHVVGLPRVERRLAELAEHLRFFHVSFVRFSVHKTTLLLSLGIIAHFIMLL